MRDKTLNQIAEEVYENARLKGFHDNDSDIDTFIQGATNNLHNEVSELHEAWRARKLDHYCDKKDGMAALGLVPLTCLEEELADIIIRTLDNAKTLGVDIERAVEVKHFYNKSRSYKHGGKKN
jgi:NTP pyrophosphatase (non-canonical NTP hydrolase)